MATEEELMQLQESLKPFIREAIAHGEDLSTHEHMLQFVLRILEQGGYVQRGDKIVQSSN